MKILFVGLVSFKLFAINTDIGLYKDDLTMNFNIKSKNDKILIYPCSHKSVTDLEKPSNTIDCSKDDEKPIVVSKQDFKNYLFSENLASYEKDYPHPVDIKNELQKLNKEIVIEEKAKFDDIAKRQADIETQIAKLQKTKGVIDESTWYQNSDELKSKLRTILNEKSDLEFSVKYKTTEKRRKIEELKDIQTRNTKHFDSVESIMKKIEANEGNYTLSNAEDAIKLIKLINVVKNSQDFKTVKELTGRLPVEYGRCKINRTTDKTRVWVEVELGNNQKKEYWFENEIELDSQGKFVKVNGTDDQARPIIHPFHQDECKTAKAQKCSEKIQCDETQGDQVCDDKIRRCEERKAAYIERECLESQYNLKDTISKFINEKTCLTRAYDDEQEVLMRLNNALGDSDSNDGTLDNADREIDVLDIKSKKEKTSSNTKVDGN